MKVLIVGFGAIGRRHYKNLLKIKGMKIIICTKRKNLQIKNNDVKIISDIDNCLKENPDVGFITNETAFHVSTAIKLANQGLDLFIEKPLSNSTSGIKKLNKIVKKRKIITQMGCNLRFHNCIKKIRKLIIEEKIGKIISVQCENGSYLPDWHPYEDYRKSYAGKNNLGGGIIFTMIHEIDYLYWMFGYPKLVASISGKFSNLSISADDYSASLIEFKKKIIAELHLDFFQRPQERGCKIKGTKGIITWESEQNKVMVYFNKKKKWEVLFHDRNHERNQMYIDEIKHFFKCVKNREQTINNLEAGIETMNIALAIKRSSIKRKFVEMV
tara:strand:- start:1081 stop:2064 length:984 start_codon:yes stop_codon:yes gene_type:complete